MEWEKPKRGRPKAEVQTTSADRMRKKRQLAAERIERISDAYAFTKDDTLIEWMAKEGPQGEDAWIAYGLRRGWGME